VALQICHLRHSCCKRLLYFITWRATFRNQKADLFVAVRISGLYYRSFLSLYYFLLFDNVIPIVPGICVYSYLTFLSNAFLSRNFNRGYNGYHLDAVAHRQCAAGWKVTGSIPDGIFGTFHWPNPAGRTNKRSSEGKSGRWEGLTSFSPSSRNSGGPQTPEGVRVCPGQKWASFCVVKVNYPFA